MPPPSQTERFSRSPTKLQRAAYCVMLKRQPRLYVTRALHHGKAEDMPLSVAVATSLQAELQDETFHSIGRQWHVDIVDFVRHDAPKILVILLVAFVLQRTVSFLSLIHI